MLSILAMFGDPVVLGPQKCDRVVDSGQRPRDTCHLSGSVQIVFFRVYGPFWELQPLSSDMQINFSRSSKSMSPL